MDWQLITDVSGQPMDPIFRDQAIQELDCSTPTNTRCVTSQNSEDLTTSLLRKESKRHLEVQHHRASKVNKALNIPLQAVSKKKNYLLLTDHTQQPVLIRLSRSTLNHALLIKWGIPRTPI
jgi:capsule polysaccharide export protein KpsC/LpsZ